MLTINWLVRLPTLVDIDEGRMQLKIVHHAYRVWIVKTGKGLKVHITLRSRGKNLVLCGGQQDLAKLAFHIAAYGGDFYTPRGVA